MRARYKEYQPSQMLLLPLRLQDWLPKDHLAYFISDIVDQMDLGVIHRPYEIESRGQPAFHPTMMTKLLLYGYCVGIPSSRKIEKRTYEDVAFRVLTAGNNPDHDTIADFRKRHLKSLTGLFVQVLQLCREAGLVKLGHVALDGTKVKANASKHKAMSYSRMCEKEKELARQVEEMLQKAEAVDAEEDAKYGKGKRGDELPEELRFRQSRLKKIREAKQALEERAKQEALDKGKLDQSDSPKAARGRKPKTISGTPKPTDQRNFTDPDSRIMRDGATKSFVQAYNCQAAVDAEAQVIVAADVAQETNDKQQIKPMTKKIKENLEQLPSEISADAGYFSEDNANHLKAVGVGGYICPDKLKHGEERPVVRGRIPNDISAKDRMRRKLWTKRGRETYSKRKETAEPVFGQIKEVRGFRQFLLRGVENVRGEWSLICATHNLLKLFRHGMVPQRG